MAMVNSDTIYNVSVINADSPMKEGIKALTESLEATSVVSSHLKISAAFGN